MKTSLHRMWSPPWRNQSQTRWRNWSKKICMKFYVDRSKTGKLSFDLSFIMSMSKQCQTWWVRELSVTYLDAQIANYFTIFVGAENLSKRLLSSSSYMEPIAMVVKRKVDPTMEEKKYSTASELKVMVIVEPYTVGSDSLPSRSESESGKSPCIESPNSRSNVFILSVKTTTKNSIPFQSSCQ